MKSCPFPFRILVSLGFLSVLIPSILAGETIADGFEAGAAGAQLESGANGSTGVGLAGGVGWGGTYDVSNAIKSLVKVENRAAAPVVYSSGGISLHGGERALRFYDIANGSYAVQRPLGRVFSAPAGETVWFSFLFRTSAASPLTNQDFFQVGFDDNSNASSGSPRVSIGANTLGTVFAPTQPFQFFARSTTTVANSSFDGSVSIAAGTTYLLVGRVSASGGTFTEVMLYVNPTTLTEPAIASASVTANSGLMTISHLFIRTVGLDNGDAYVLDELKIGNDYGSVVSPGPLGDILRWSPPIGMGDIGVLRWSALFGGVLLETSPSMEPNTWSIIPSPFTRVGDEFQFPVLGGAEREFYRLRR